VKNGQKTTTTTETNTLKPPHTVINRHVDEITSSNVILSRSRWLPDIASLQQTFFTPYQSKKPTTTAFFLHQTCRKT